MLEELPVISLGAQIASCYNEGSISAAEGARTSAGFGGIAGCIEAASSNPTTVSNCYNTGAVTASGTSQRAGGIVGVNNSSGAVVEYCYNIGTVSDTVAANAGSIAGSSRGTVKSCITITDALSAAATARQQTLSRSKKRHFPMQIPLHHGRISIRTGRLIRCWADRC